MGSIRIKDIEKILGKSNSIIFFEIGANRGSDTKRFLEIFSNIKMFCFEPDPRCVRKFRKYISDKRVTLIEAAVSNIHDQEIDLYLSGGTKKKNKTSQHINSSSIKIPFNHLIKHPWCNFNKKIKVKTVSLDMWCNENNIDYIDWLWADVQGAEEELIAGSKYILKNTKYFYTEYSDEELYKGQINKNRILKLLPNFEFIADYGNNILLINKNIK